MEIKNRKSKCPSYIKLYFGKTHVGNYTYFVQIVRICSWPSICQACEGGTYDLISFLRKHFKVFDVPENITSDGGPEFASHKVQNFLKSWNVEQRTSSECYPSALTTAKLEIEFIERTLRGYTTKSEYLNYDGFNRAITRYRNTPRGDIGTSPSNILFE